MAETRREMSRELSKSRPNLYHRLRGSPSKGLVGARVGRLEALQEPTLDLLAQALEARDQLIASHSARVAELAARLAQQVDPGLRNVELVRMAGMLHDLGVIGVRDDILNKPGPLREDEWKLAAGTLDGVGMFHRNEAGAAVRRRKAPIGIQSGRARVVKSWAWPLHGSPLQPCIRDPSDIHRLPLR